MRLIIAMILVFALTCRIALAECDYSTGITVLSDGGYRYTKECHIAVGTMKRDLEAANKQVDSYKEAFTLKDLALGDANQRAIMWKDTSLQLQDRMSKIDELESKNKFLYIGLGILITGAAVYGAGQLRGK